MTNNDNSYLENKTLKEKVEKETPIKEWLVNYVGNKCNPESNEVNVEMIIKIMAEDFPEFLLVLAEENFIRGYQQALADVDEGEKLAQKEGVI